MRKPTDDEIRVLGRVAVNNPAFVEWLGQVRDVELNQLPHVVNATAVAQGRCQVLTELHKLLKQAPELAAQLRRSS